MEFKGTSGNWYISGSTFIKSEKGVTIGAYFALFGDRNNIEADANAQLIATAPELLQAAINIDRLSDEILKSGDDDRELPIEFAELKKAINKALGKEG